MEIPPLLTKNILYYIQNKTNTFSGMTRQHNHRQSMHIREDDVENTNMQHRLEKAMYKNIHNNDEEIEKMNMMIWALNRFADTGYILQLCLLLSKMNWHNWAGFF